MGSEQDGMKYGRDFFHNAWGIYQRHGVHDSSSHLKSDDEPFGGNVGFLDGHGEWRAFDPPIEDGVAVPRATIFFW
jgi:prepilin-type processing-associated H-X9-DG protein